jgi:hypothetical protein
MGIAPSVDAIVADVNSAPPSPSSLSVSVVTQGERALLSATARSTSLHALLAEIAARAGFQFTELAPTGRTVSVVCRWSPLDVALRQLLQDEGASFMFVYRSLRPQQLQQVVLLGANGGAPARSHRRFSLQLQPPEKTACMRSTVDGSEEQNEFEEKAKVIADDIPTLAADMSLEQLLALTTSENGQIRTAAFEALGALHPTDERARRKIVAGVRDPDAYIRSLAIGALGANWTQWPEAEKLAMAALHDEEPTVRLHALQILWDKAQPRINEILSIVLQDDDPGVQGQVNEFLQEVSSPATFEP